MVCHFKTNLQVNVYQLERLSSKRPIQWQRSLLPGVITEQPPIANHFLSLTLPTEGVLSQETFSVTMQSLPQCHHWVPSHFKTISDCNSTASKSSVLGDIHSNLTVSSLVSSPSGLWFQDHLSSRTPPIERALCPRRP